MAHSTELQVKSMLPRYRLPIWFLFCTVVGNSCARPAVAPEPAATVAATAQKPLQASHAEDPHPGNFRLVDFVVRERLGRTRLHLRFSKTVPNPHTFITPEPLRLSVEIPALAGRTQIKETFRIGTRWIDKVAMQSTEKGYLVEISLPTSGVPPHTVELADEWLTVSVGRLDPDLVAEREWHLVKDGKRIRHTSLRGPLAPKPPFTKAEPALASRAGNVRPEGKPAPRISFDFKDADIKNVLRLLADLSGRNIVVTEDVQQRITLRLVNVPWDQALEVLLRSNGLVQERIGEVIRVSSLEQVTAQRNGLQAARESEERLDPLETLLITVNYANVTELTKKLQPILSPRGTAIPDARTNTILIRDVARGVRAATRIVGRMDTRPPQVLIESNIIETTPTFARALGTELRFTVPTDPQSNDLLFPRTGALGTSPTTEGELERSIPGLFPGGASVDSNAFAGAPFVPGALGGTLAIIQNRAGAFRHLSAVLTAAEQKGELKIISRPSVVTLNNVQSTIQSLRVVRVALPEGSTNIASGTGAAAGSAVATEQIPVGITLSVAPQVSGDGFILLNIKVKTSELGGVSFGAAVPDEITREAISNVMIRDGETVVIGGIMKNTREKRESGVPFLKEIPVLGWFFKRESLRDDFEELMVFITPRIVHTGGKDLPDAEKLWRETLSKTRGPGIRLPHSRP